MRNLLINKRIFLVIIFFFSATLFPSSAVFAEDNVYFCTENPSECEDEKTPEAEPTSDSGTNNEDNSSPVGLSAWDYIKTGFSLLFVIGLLVFLLKFINRKNRTYDKNRFMRNMGGISLGQQKSVQLVVVGERYYLVGVGDDINLLKEITDRAEIDALTEYYEDSDSPSNLGWIERFISWFSEMREGRNTNQSNEEQPDFKNVFNTRLEELKKERKQHINRLTEKERNRDD